jgi:membrane AbrB-like protein
MATGWRGAAARLVPTLAIGAAGGAAAAWAGLPAGWLAGSMTAVAAAALAGLPLALPDPFRNAAFVLIGISMGAAVTPDTLQQLRAWPWSVALLAASVAATLLAGTAWLERVHRWDPVTARYASIPGALSSVLVLAATSTADLARVALAQSIRLFTLVALMPTALTLLGGSGVVARAPDHAVSLPAEIVVTLAASAAAAAALAGLRVPGGVLLGAMTASAVLHGAGLIEGRFPPGILIVGFVTTGAVIGVRFRGTRIATLVATLPGAVASVLLALLLSAGFAGLGAVALGLPFGQLWLAYAPGGVEAMAIMAFALQLDAAFVGAHHVLRLFGLNLLSPWWRRSA